MNEAGRRYRQMVRESYFDTIVGKEFFEFVCGDLVGYGLHRCVFEYVPDPSCVIKFQNERGFQNAEEWEVWKVLRNTPMSKWLAPCVAISENGIWMVQKRTSDIPASYRLPELVPRWMTDIKRSNFGLIGKRLVCHDYANNLNINHAISTAMKRAEWRLD